MNRRRSSRAFSAVSCRRTPVTGRSAWPTCSSHSGAAPRNWRPLAHRCAPWLAVAARNRAIDCYNALRRRETVTLDDGLAETLGELAEFDSATTEAADLVGALVAAMTPPDRDIFLRKYYLLQSGKEIAAALGMSVESVNTRLSRGRDRLRRELTEKGVYSHA